MKSRFRFLSLLSRLGKDKHASRPRLLARLLRDEEGSYLILGSVLFPVLIGVGGLLLLANFRVFQILHINLWRLWPLVLIAVGFMMFRDRAGRS